MATSVPKGAAGSSDTVTTQRGRRKPYLHSIDLIRATTFTLVIFVHCLTMTTDEFGSVPVNTTTLLLHFTRNAFFALTGFVLMYQAFDQADFRAGAFWRKRIKLVIFPYVAWSAVYWIVKDMWGTGRLSQIPENLGDFFYKLSWGLSGFQMYFLFVMLQVYILFPLVLWLVRATVGRHGMLLAASMGVQLVVTMTITHWQPPDDLAPYWWHHYATFVPYQFYILYGAVAAVHREAINNWIRGKGWWLAGGLVLTAGFAIGHYLAGLYLGEQPIHSNDSPFFPTLLPFVIVAITCLYSATLYWSDHWRGRSPFLAKGVRFAANRSFGVFLVHVLVLFFILRPQSDGRPWVLETFGQPLGTIVVFLGTIAGSLVLVEILRRLPGSLYLTGRPRIPLRSRPSL